MRPSGSGTLVVCEFPVCLVEDLAVLLPGGTLGGTQEEEVEKEKERAQERRTEGMLSGREQRERH